MVGKAQSDGRQVKEENMRDSFLEYKGYQGSVHYNNEDRVFFGKVMFIPALVSYEGTDVDSLTKSFEEAVDDYLLSTV